MSKELWMQAYEELVEEYLEEHPGAIDQHAEDFADTYAGERMADNLASLGDQLRKEKQENE